MAQGWGNQAYSPRALDQAAYDVGLRRYMLSIYNYMAGGLAVTGLVAFLVTSSPEAMHAIFGTPLQWVVMLAPLGFVIFFSARIGAMSLGAAQITFWLFAATMGLSLASIFYIYTGNSIARVFFVTAAAFAGTSLYGYTTRTDLSRFGAIKEQHGGSAFAFFSCSKATNEVNFVAQKFARAVLASNNIDSCNRT